MTAFRTCGKCGARLIPNSDECIVCGGSGKAKTVRELIEEGRENVLALVVKNQATQIACIETMTEALKMLAKQVSEMNKRLDKLLEKR